MQTYRLQVEPGPFVPRQSALLLDVRAKDKGQLIAALGERLQLANVSLQVWDTDFEEWASPATLSEFAQPGSTTRIRVEKASPLRQKAGATGAASATTIESWSSQAVAAWVLGSLDHIFDAQQCRDISQALDGAGVDGPSLILYGNTLADFEVLRQILNLKLSESSKLFSAIHALLHNPKRESCPVSEGVPVSQRPSRNPLATELAGLGLGVLSKRAITAGVSEDALLEAQDSDRPKDALIDLILQHAPADLRSELGSLGLGTLSKKAKEAGATEEALLQAQDAPNPKKALIELIMGCTATTALTPDPTAALRQELSSLKLGSLSKRAKDSGVPEEEVLDAFDEDEPQEALIALILDASTRTAAPGVEAAQAAAASLREELTPLKLRAVKQRAKDVGVGADELDEADDAEDIKAAVIDLILAKLATRSEVPGRDRKHVGFPFRTDGAKSKPAKPFGSRHVMLSYCHACCQEKVKKVHGILGRHGIPCWMDIDNGMNTDIYDSMAAGVQNAAAVICFMSQKYEASANCALELKFAQQTGVPIVPVMAQSNYSAGSWLGILTAGSLWTPLFDEASFDDNLQLLIRQVYKSIENVVPGDAVDTVEETVFTIDDVKGELERMRAADEELNSTTKGATSELSAAGATIPAVVPSLPAGLRVTTEMKQLLGCLVDSDATRVGFCGMGGIGKTVISSWLVRQPSVRKEFEKIAWVAIGQTPNVDECQETLFTQLTKSPWDNDASDDKKKLLLQNAFTGKKILLVIDDAWEAEHEAMLNFLDSETDSKVLISSRVRAFLAGSDSEQKTEIVDISLPSKEDAVQMLLSTGGVPADRAVPPEAFELVQFCNFLPLAIGISGKLISELELNESADWGGIVAVMKQEFAENKSHQTVEEAVIATSLKGLRGSQSENIIRLFRALAIIPEDTACPLSIMAMIFQACASASSTESVPRPSILSIRRWLKVLIDRSLVLGTVDRFFVHDLVLDYCTAQHSAAEIKAAHRILVDFIRDSRPQTAGQKEWRWGLANDASCKYVRFQIEHHIRQSGWNPTAKPEWLLDLPQDDIVVMSSKVAGFENLSKLVVAAEGRSDDQATVAKLAALAARTQFLAGGAALALGWSKKAAEQLTEIATAEVGPEIREGLDRLEIEVLGSLFSAQDMESFEKYGHRPEYLCATSPGRMLAADVAFLFFYQSFMQYLMPMLSAKTGPEVADALRKFQNAWMRFPEHLAASAAAAETSQYQREKCMMTLTSIAPSAGMLRHEKFGFDKFFGEEGQFLKLAVEVYDYDSHHEWMCTTQMGLDSVLVGYVVPDVLSYHYGDVGSCVHYLKDKILQYLERVLDEPNRAFQWPTLISFWWGWPNLALLVGADTELAQAVATIFAKAQLTWHTADATVDTAQPSWPSLTARGISSGEKEGDIGWSCVEAWSWGSKLMWVLLASKPGVSAEELMDGLPSVAELKIFLCSGNHNSALGCFGTATLTTLVGLVCEKMGHHEQALTWADATISPDYAGIGTMSGYAHAIGYRLKGRCLAQLGRTSDAVAVFEQVAALGDELGLYLHELLALAELQSLTGQKCMDRIKLAMHKMLGPSPTEAQVESINKAKLPPGVTWSMIMA